MLKIVWTTGLVLLSTSLEMFLQTQQPLDVMMEVVDLTVAPARISVEKVKEAVILMMTAKGT